MLDRMGSRMLQKILNEHLERHIKEKLPAIHSNMKKTLREIENELKEIDPNQLEEMSKAKHLKR